MLIGVSGKIKSGKDLLARLIQDLDSKSWEVKKYGDKLKDITCLILGCTRQELEDQDFKEKELGEEWRIWGYQTYDHFSGTKIGKISGFCMSEKEATKLEKEDRKSYQWTKDLDCKITSYILTPRLFLQLIGTECGRQIIHPNIWVNSTMRNYEESYFNNPYYDDKNIFDILEADEIKNPQMLPNWIITDVRFPNEAKAIKDKGGILIRLDRPLKDRFPELWEEFSKTSLGWEEFLKQKDPSLKLHKTFFHDSETGLDDYKDWDYVCDAKNLEELEKFTKNLIENDTLFN